MSKSKSEIIWSHTPHGEYPNYWHETDIEQMMDDYAKDQMTTLLNNISRLPVEVYSEKVKGQDKKYFLGRKFVEDLIKRIK